MVVGIVQVLNDGPKNYVIKVTGDTATAAQKIIDVTAMTYNATSVRLWKVVQDILDGVAVELLWDASTPLRIYKFNADSEVVDFRDFGGIWNNAGAGKTGNVLMTVTGTGSYSLTLHFKKSNAVVNN